MRVVVIGGSGHIGSFLIPRLVRSGHDVTNISRGIRAAYIDSPEWHDVHGIVADRQVEDSEGIFGSHVVALEPDVVVDLICFTFESAVALVDALRDNTDHLLHCGSMWRYGPSGKLPISEDTGTAPFGEYGIQKDRIARMLKEEAESGGLVTTSLHPGHIVGPGWLPIGPVGNHDRSVWFKLSCGQTLQVPGIGTELMHHVHADDVAQAFEKAIQRRTAAAGQDFNVVASTALNVRGYAHEVASWFGQTAALETVTWEQFREASPEHAEVSWEHLYRSQCLRIDKAKEILGYAPRYEPESALLESVRWLVERDELTVARPLID